MELGNYLNKFQKKRGNFRSDLIQLISRKVHRTYPQIMKLVENWDIETLKRGTLEAEKGEINFWVFRKNLCQ